VFVSYHHGGDRDYYETFVRLYQTKHEIVHDNSPERRIESADPDYVIRRLREGFLTGASTTIVLCGRNTPGRKYVDWEILASLNQQMGIVGIYLPTALRGDANKVIVPDRLHDNVQSGYALFRAWETLQNGPDALPSWVEESLTRDRVLINNRRDRRLANAPLK
jgi:hypothetical protein